MTLWLIPQGGSQKRHRLIDPSFKPCFYVQGPEPRLRRLGQALAARARLTCALTERANIWDGQGLRVLQVSVHHPTQFASLARFVHRYDAGLQLYNSDLMLAPRYCWEKGVFPLAKVDVEVSECVGSAPPSGLGTRDSGRKALLSRAPNPESRIPKYAPSSVATTSGQLIMSCRRSG